MLSIIDSGKRLIHQSVSIQTGIRKILRLLTRFNSYHHHQIMDKVGEPLGALLNWWISSTFVMFDVFWNPFRRVVGGVTWCKETIKRLLSGAKSAAKRMIIFTVFFVVILWVSILLYASFYHIYVPSASILRPAHFKFRVCPSGVGMCTFPMANVTLGAENRPEVLGRGQQYRVFLKLQVPDSVPNRDVGMFMVVSRIYDRKGSITQESSRAVTLKYQSDLLKIIQTIILSPFYITGFLSGFLEETQTLNIELFHDFWDDYYQPTVGVLVEIHNRHLVFYSSELQFHATYSGLRYYLFYYPLISAFSGIFFNCFWLSGILLLTWFQLGLGLLDGTNGKDGQSSREERMGNRRTSNGDIRQTAIVERAGAADLEPDEKEEDVETVPKY